VQELHKLKNRVRKNALGRLRYEHREDLARYYEEAQAEIPQFEWSAALKEARESPPQISWEVVIHANLGGWEYRVSCSFPSRTSARENAVEMLDELGEGEARIYRRKGIYRDERAGLCRVDGRIGSNFEDGRRITNG